MVAFLGRKVIILAFILLRKAWLGSKLGDSGSRNPFYMGLELMQGLKIYVSYVVMKRLKCRYCGIDYDRLDKVGNV